MTRAQLATLAKVVGAVAPSVLADLACLAGFLMAVHGVYEIYPPAAWIGAGLALIGGAYLSRRKAS